MYAIKHALQSLAWYVEQDKESYAIIIGVTLGVFVAFSLIAVTQ